MIPAAQSGSPLSGVEVFSALQGPIYPLITLDGTPNLDDDWGTTYADPLSDTSEPNFDILSYRITNDSTSLFVAVSVASIADANLNIFLYADKDGGESGVNIDTVDKNPWDTQDIIVNADSPNRIDGAFCAWTDITQGVQVYKNNAGAWSAPVQYDQLFGETVGMFMNATFAEFAIPLADMGLAVGDTIEYRLFTTGGAGTPAYDSAHFTGFDMGEVSADDTTSEIFAPSFAGDVTYEIK
jgi:hypothetical protein